MLESFGTPVIPHFGRNILYCAGIIYGKSSDANQKGAVTLRLGHVYLPEMKRVLHVLDGIACMFRALDALRTKRGCV